MSNVGHVASVNLGAPLEIEYRGRIVRTAIYKEPVEGPVQVNRLGITGDTQVDQKHHGGVHQAVYVYFCESYEYWKNLLNRKSMPGGQFGENLTIGGFDEQTIKIGDFFQIGDVKLQISQPRQPCYKLAMKMEIDDFIDRFLTSHRLGCYCRVLREGIIKKGAKVTHIPSDEPSMSIWDVGRIRFFEPKNLKENATASQLTALSPEWKKIFDQRIKGTEFDEKKT